jgi:DNA-binding MarR family transcriptional regulator
MVKIGLTDKGKQAVADTRIQGSGARVLRYLDNNGPSSPEEISSDMKTTPRMIVRLATSLYRRGYVEKS